jgi:predicted phage replisome organizer
LPAGDSILVIWFKILCLAGNVNEDGAMFLTRDIPYTEDMLATEFHRPIDTVRLALKVLQQFGMIEIIDNVYQVTNWQRYQNIDGLERIREQTRIRVARYKENQKLLQGNVSGNAEVTQSNAPRTKNQELRTKNQDKDTTPKPPKGDSEPSTINQFIKSLPYSESFKSAFHDFAEMRRTIKHPMTVRAAQMILNNLDKLSADEKTRIDILNQSIEHSWQGVFEIKGNQQSVKGKQPDYSDPNRYAGEQEDLPEWAKK